MTDVIVQLSTARCDRVAACARRAEGGNGGVDRDVCMNEVGHQVVTVLADGQCPEGVPRERLASCLAAIEAVSCDTGLSTLDAVPSCGRARLCGGVSGGVLAMGTEVDAGDETERTSELDAPDGSASNGDAGSAGLIDPVDAGAM